MKLYRIPLGMYATNCYIVADEASGEALIIDPGSEADKVEDLLTKNQLTPIKVLLTHGHHDHTGAVQAIIDKYHIPLAISAADKPMLTDPQLSLGSYMGGAAAISAVPELLQEGDQVACGSLSFKVLATPGHTEGGICFYGEGIVIAGDTLFQGSIGRTDFPGGSFEVLEKSIQDKLYTLPEDTVVYPGHGPETTIRQEKLSNPFVR